jgi:hypothetical protein
VKRSLFIVSALGALGCSVGEGEGWVKSENLFMQDCWNGAYDLGPTFFAANPSPGSKSLTIRVQKGDNIEEVSDGLVVVINELPAVRGQMGSDLEVGLPVGVAPPGVPVVYDENPPNVSLALYLHESCHAQNSSIYSLGGTINFDSLFSGDPYEDEAGDRLTEGTFDVRFADPRLLVGTEAPENAESRVRGYFRFFYQRGQPAQPFQ